MVFVLVLSVFLFCVSGHPDRKQPSRPLSSQEAQRDHVKRNCSVCADGADCCGGEVCCGGSHNSSSICCGFGTSCCDGECCETIETCCPDKVHGAICCIAENTFCCPLDNFGNPSHCCPHWNVCCPGGKFGCCDPGSLRFAEDNYAYSLFAKASVEGGMPLSILKIDLNTGDKTETLTSFNTNGEIVRSFVFAPKIGSFVLPQTNFLSTTMNVSIWKIGVNGSTTQVALSPIVPTGLVTGFCWSSELNQVILATYNVQKTGYLFYKSDPATGATQLFASSTFSQGDTYAGWFKRCGFGANGPILYRLGYEFVVSEENFGIGVTQFSGNIALTKFFPQQSPAGLAVYGSFDVFSNNTFISLAGAGSTDGPYSVVQWSLQGQPKIIARLTNAHEAVKFGPISTTINPEKTQFAAITTTRNLLGNKYDRWELCLVSLVNNVVRQHDLSPWMIAETDSAAGVGFLPIQ